MSFLCIILQVYWETVLNEMNISFSIPPKCILNEESSFSNGESPWLCGAFVNPARNCLALNEKRTLNDTVIVWRDEWDDDMPVNKITLKELRSEVWYVI